MEVHFKRVAIIGVGLMGGSLGLALRKSGIAGKIIGIGRNPERLAEAKKRKAIDEAVTDFHKGVQNADIVVICTPVRNILPILKDLRFDFPDNCIVTDVGSTKGSIVKGAKKILSARMKTVAFIGSHPMAGSEQFGIAAAVHDLYKGAVCIVTPTKKATAKDVCKVTLLWESVGCKVVHLTPEQHDRSVAIISHLPHVLASTLVNTAGKMNGTKGKLPDILAKGFKDSTRIASSHPQIWTDICMENQQAILTALNEFQKELNNFKKEIKAGREKEIFQKFDSAKSLRELFLSKSSNPKLK